MAKPAYVVWNASSSVAQNAASWLPELAEAYFRMGGVLLRGAPSLEALHRFRLETKRFRYTLELFRPCYGPGLNRSIDQIRQIQDQLGEINDCHTAQRLAGSRNPAVLSFLARRVSRHQRLLMNRWRSNFGSAARRRSITAYLAEAPKEPR